MSANQGAIRVEGLNESVRALKRIGTPLAEIKEAAKESADLVANSARGIAPSRTGRLRASIKSAVLLKGAVVRAGGARVPYSNPIHWGWFYDRNNNHARNIKPNPFFVRALGYRRKDIIESYERNMKKLIQEQELKQNQTKGL